MIVNWSLNFPSDEAFIFSRPVCWREINNIKLVRYGHITGSLQETIFNKQLFQYKKFIIICENKT